MLKHFRLNLILLVAVVFSLFAATDIASAKEKQTIKDGISACKAWCDKKNKTIGSQTQCHRKCELYWACNGSDSTARTCADTKSAALEVPTPPPGSAVPPKVLKGVAINPNSGAGLGRPSP